MAPFNVDTVEQAIPDTVTYVVFLSLYAVSLIVSWAGMGWLIWQNRQRDKTIDALIATTTLRRAAEQSGSEAERMVGLHGLAARLNSLRLNEPSDYDQEPEVETDGEGVEITSTL